MPPTVSGPYITMRVTLPGWEDWPLASFPATVPVFESGPSAGEPIRWNGWIACPLFTREVAEQVVKLLSADSRNPDGTPYVEQDDPQWDGDTLVMHNLMWRDEEPDYEPELIEPDDNGRYAIGGYSYCWFEAERATFADKPRKEAQ